MSSGLRWTATALAGAGAGAVAALVRARRERRASLPQAPPREALGVDGLGEPDREEEAPPPSDAAPPPGIPAAGTAASSAPQDPIAALDAARDRLRRRAEELQREMGPPSGGAEG